jgi:hypothetical protein
VLERGGGDRDRPDDGGGVQVSAAVSIGELAQAVEDLQAVVLSLKATADSAYRAYDEKRSYYLELQKELRVELVKSGFIGVDYEIAKTKGVEV